MHLSDKKSLRNFGPLERYQALHLIQVPSKQTHPYLTALDCPFTVFLFGYGVIQHTLEQLDQVDQVIQAWRASDKEWIVLILGITNHWVRCMQSCYVAGKSGQQFILDSVNYFDILDLDSADTLIDREVGLMQDEDRRLLGRPRLDDFQKSVRRQKLQDIQAAVKLLQSCLYQSCSLKAARLTREVQYVIHTWDKHVVDHLWAGYRGLCYVKAAADGVLDSLKTRVYEWMMEELRPECIRSDLLNSIMEIGQAYLEAETKTQLRRWIDDIEPLLEHDPLDERVLRVFNKLRSVVADLKGVC